MSTFTGGVIERVGNPGLFRPQRWRTVTPCKYSFGPAILGWTIVIPAGYEFDVSWPWWAAPFLPRKRMRLAGALHDFARHQLGWELWFTDLMFLDALRAQGVGEPWRSACWFAVRLSKRRD